MFALVTLSAGVPAQLGRELRAYGANHVLVPVTAPLRLVVGGYELGSVEETRTLPVTDLQRIPSTLVEAIAPGLKLTVRLRGIDTAATGYDLDALRAMNPSWRVSPRWPTGPNEILLGTALAARLGVRAGDALEVSSERATAQVTVGGIVETGTGEDDAVQLPLSLAQVLAEAPGRMSLALLRVRAASEGTDSAARAIASAVPGAEVRTIAQVARAETALLGKVRRLLAIVTGAVGAASAFTVSGTLGILLLARRREIGLCMALGAEPRTLRRFLLTEACVASIVAGAAACIVGAGTAEAIAVAAFGTMVPLGPMAAVLALASSLGVGLGGAIWPVRRALAAAPCDSLRAP